MRHEREGMEDTVLTCACVLTKGRGTEREFQVSAAAGGKVKYRQDKDQTPKGFVHQTKELDSEVIWAMLAHMVNSLPAMQETWVRSPGWEDPLEKGMVTHSSILAWRIPWTEEPCRL